MPMQGDILPVQQNERPLGIQFLTFPFQNQFYMKSTFSFFLLSLLFCLSLRAQFVTIPDPNFVTYLQTNMPACMNGNQMDTTCSGITTYQVVNVSNKNISDLTGIQYFDAMVILDCSMNQLTSLPNLPQTTLVSLRADINQLTALPPLNNGMVLLTAGNNPLATLPPLPSTLVSLYVPQIPNLVLPPLPTGLQDLDIEGCNYSTLPALPAGLKLLFCGNNPLHTLPPLPPTLESLSFINIQLTAFPAVPSTVTSLGFGYDSVGTYPGALPPGLISLTCFHAQMTALPALPPNMTDLHCQYNLLTSLPPIPSTMTLMEIAYNQLTSLPALPNGLQNLLASYNQITSVSNLPPSLYSAALDNNQITCFGPFPQSTTLNVQATNNPFTCIPNYPAYMNPMIGTVPICAPGNALGCVSGEGIGGSVFDDLNADCMLNGIDPGVKNIPVKLYDNLGTFVQAVSSHEAGAYFFDQAVGTWKVAIDTAGKPYRVTCNNPGLDSTVVLSTPLALGVDFEVDCKPGYDVGVNGVGLSGILFPGQPFASRIYAGDISNFYGLHCATGVTGQVVVNFSGPATYTGVMPGALTPVVAGNTFTYNIADFGTVNSLVDFGLEFSMLTTATITDTICFDVTVSPSLGDMDPVNNSYQLCAPVVNSHDPNAKEVYPATVPPGYDGWLNYTIHFQNTGNAPAFNIRLEDTLDSHLDWESLEVLDASHYNTWHLTGNRFVVHFPNIMLPDSMTNPAGSQGWVLFRMKPLSGLPIGTAIPNTASIYFDFNAPIVTNTATTSYALTTSSSDASVHAPKIMVYPNPSPAVFQVEYPQDWQHASWTVCNLMGQTVLHQAAAGGHFAVDLSGQAAGYYLLKLSDGKQEYVRQLVRQ